MVNGNSTTSYTAFDPVGNLLNSNQLTAAQNYLFSYSYNLTGSLVAETYPSGRTLTTNYDGANRQLSLSGQIGSATRTYLYVYGAFGQLAAEYYNGVPALQSPCTTCFLSYDHLGSVRLVTDGNGGVVSRHDYLPYGEEIPANVGGRSGTQFGAYDGISQRFTGQMRDAETGEDYFNARMFGSAFGRFTSPDPGNAGADLYNPQTWNAYSYAAGNPLVNTDPTGTAIISRPDDGDCYSAQYSTPCNGGFPPAWGDGGIGGGLDIGIGGGGGGGRPPVAVAPTPAPVTTPAAVSSFPPESLGIPSGFSLPGPFGLDSYDPFNIEGILPAPPSFGVQANSILYKNLGYFLYGLRIWLGGSRSAGAPLGTNNNAGSSTTLFGTHYCGPVGGGTPVNPLDQACQAHDTCYDNNQLSVSSNFDFRLTPSKRAALQSCNQELCDHSGSVLANSSGGSYVRFYFRHVTPVGSCR